ncbi:MAG: hypothetical protein OXH05_12545 [Acidobacteria bacterium]|nr:hypothetical protein [Acidobacteriota bacterium]
MSARIPDTRYPGRETAIRLDPRRRTGHRQETREAGDPRSARARMEAALVDVGIHRTVATRDVVAVHFDGHPYAARRAIERLKTQGLLQERTATASRGGSFQTLAATRKGVRKAQAAAERHGFDATQVFRAGWGRPQDAAHDVAIFRAVRAAREELAAQGATARRIRLDGELRGIVSRRSETARARAGKAAADAERRRAATEYQLPVGPDGKVLFPDAQLEYTLTDEDGHDTFGRVNIEIISPHYRAAAVAAKAAAGFALFSSNGKAARNIVRHAVRAGKAATGPDTNARGGSSRPPSDLFEL